ncbi:PPK2 family polyphosphate kinase [Verminephrobacter eiseniae]|uniref:Polyphosphate kinase-2-related domain-containing protein n=1 Tax=Verminephrobacter eiseniae (strain EF01-2) TaxID=391735 RepID=A1WIK1_VEREI|nr:polyphosphate--nucleotide phosphotransferase [Verminephrobacter eiseniae]ABM57458.1 protein of unknown function DUF344 [Verminephrobacter eiseniae EF01-2]MCW5262649.1 polyphosphate--nucleotide phosphotransferase [Verminephrobacter eiseniae]MCW5283082.1 polyphosphate--nucleotide phosphotransferase [Verminephrobacter eiseniae]MCW5303397.1 polyphosphate--nucleotide phosphotransferase [Verminephrobacter eiseniae]MCW8181145.1 polyphosphate--nucleotide phosphotransferase [Verminephrobacter eiseni
MPETPALAAHFSLHDKALAQRWARWQPGPVRLPDQPTPERAFTLDSMDPGEKPFSLGEKALDQAAMDRLAVDIDALQNLFYVDKRYKLLVVLQGTDTAGKDGTIRSVFARTSALGVHAVGWKAPTEAELAHDCLWRIHQRVPQAGDITVFNRSHYEDVLVPVVNGSITPQQHRQRLAHINDFERMLSETGTIVLKFLLHIGFDEQRERLQKRLDDPAKRWKFSNDDITARKQWADYRRAYNRLLDACHTPWAPWTIVPADSKLHRNLMVATVLRAVLQNLGLRYPAGDPSLAGIKVS